jgi:putative membrane protein
VFVDYRGSLLRLLLWQWRPALLFFSAAFVTVFLHEDFGWKWMEVSDLPMGVVGGAIGIFVSFRSQAAYDRWWEGRKLWGRLVNSSRHLATQCSTYLGSRDSERARRLVHRHIAYVHVFRCLLRQQPADEDLDVQRTLTDDDRDVLRQSNPTHALLARQLDELRQAADADLITERRLQSFDDTIRELLDVQGGCERIKKTPFPMGYGFISNRLVQTFGILFPLAIVDDMGWYAVPTNMLVTLAFFLISEAGRVLEDPFSLFWNGLPLSQLSRMIEVNLREELGETDLPTIPGPDAHGVLM